MLGCRRIEFFIIMTQRICGFPVANLNRSVKIRIHGYYIACFFSWEFVHIIKKIHTDIYTHNAV